MSAGGCAVNYQIWALQKDLFGRGDSRENLCFQVVTSVSVSHVSLTVQSTISQLFFLYWRCRTRTFEIKNIYSLCLTQEEKKSAGI